MNMLDGFQDALLRKLKIELYEVYFQQLQGVKGSQLLNENKSRHI